MNQIYRFLLFLLTPVFFQPAWALSQDDLMPAEQAFAISSKIEDSSVILSWDIADGYYLYRDKFSFKIKNAEASLGAIEFPQGKIKHDPYFGRVEIYRKHVNIKIPVSTESTEPFVLSIKTQGCADVGVCYPPVKTKLDINPDDFNSASYKQTVFDSSNSLPLAEQDQIALALQNDTLAWTGLSFFGFGLLLAFTPCCLPMIPILSGIIVGQGNKISTSRAFSLSLIYVIATALTYTVFGVLAGLFGNNLQAVFQNPWVISSFSTIFILLSFSMFGFYELQLPSGLQEKASTFSNQQQSGSAIGVGIMGVLSALIVGPCVAAPLAGALIYIGQTGDAVLGGIALFMMGLGMGVPLLVVGTSAGKLLPKAGTWMKSVKTVFGVLLLAVAVWLLGRIIPTSIGLLLWALLLIIPAIYLGAIDPLPDNAVGWHKMRKGIGVVFLLYGSSIFIGVLSGSNDPLLPLKGLAGNVQAQQNSSHLSFTQISSTQKLDEQLQLAADNNQWLMLDFYADWCVSCVEMEHDTFTDPAVQKALSSVRLIQVDVTENHESHKQLLNRFGLIGPPAILFFNPDSKEHRTLRTIGFKNANDFLQNLQGMKMTI